MAPMQAHTPRKRFGQNFLVDTHYVERIVAAVDPRPGDNIVEIGPGLAALTARLVAGAGRIAAVEIDRDLAAAAARAASRRTRSTLHVADALDVRLPHRSERDLRVVGNLPYNISSPLLFHLADHADVVRDIHVMLQREVVARMTAGPGDEGLRAAVGDAADALRRRAAVHRAGRRVPAGAEGRVGGRAARAARRRAAAASSTRRCSRASSRRRSGSAARRCATRCPRWPTRRPSKPPASIRRRAARRCRCRRSCGSPTRSRRGRRALTGRLPARSGRASGASMRTTLSRDVAPRTIVTRASGTSNASARKARSAALALPSTGGAASATLVRAPCTPATAVRRAPGCTCNARMSAPATRAATRRVRGRRA